VVLYPTEDQRKTFQVSNKWTAPWASGSIEVSCDTEL